MGSHINYSKLFNQAHRRYNNADWKSKMKYIVLYFKLKERKIREDKRYN